MREATQARSFDEVLQSLKGRTVTEIQCVSVNTDQWGPWSLVIHFGAFRLWTVADSMSLADDHNLWERLRAPEKSAKSWRILSPAKPRRKKLAAKRKRGRS
jgi:hypothetical protein